MASLGAALVRVCVFVWELEIDWSRIVHIIIIYMRVFFV